MPTYVCSVPAGSLTMMQKTAIAEAIARIHNEATGAPQFLVQVIIDENQSVDRFLGGSSQRTTYGFAVIYALAERKNRERS